MMRWDLDHDLEREPLRRVVAAYLLSEDARRRHARLSELKALLVALGRGFFSRADPGGGPWPRIALPAWAPAAFLPQSDAAWERAAGDVGIPEPMARARGAELMARAGRFGMRGARALGADPEWTTNLVRGVLEACGLEAAGRGAPARCELLVPGVTYPEELESLRQRLHWFQREVEADLTLTLAVRVGAGVEWPRPLLAPGSWADFLELDASGLTAATWGLSPHGTEAYRESLASDPFAERDPALEDAVGAWLGAFPEDLPVTWRAGDPVVRGTSSPVLREPAEPGAPEAEAASDGDPLGHLEALVASVEAGGLDPAQALARLDPRVVDQLARPFLRAEGATALAGGEGVAPGGGCGRLALTLEGAARFREASEPYVLALPDVFGDEAELVRHAAGLMTRRGGATSHAAVVAANSGVPAVVLPGLELDPREGVARLGGRELRAGEPLGVDGSRGVVYAGHLPTVVGTESAAFQALLGWTEEAGGPAVLANADTPEEGAAALEAGAVGVGLVRSEHMFLEATRLEALRRVVLGDAAAIAELEELQRQDFLAWFRACGEYPVTFRLLDAPMEEFLPRDRASLDALADRAGWSSDDVVARAARWRPVEPMLGVRAVRLATVLPEVERAQARALGDAHRQAREEGIPAPPPKVLVPMVSGAEEMRAARRRLGALTEGLELGAMVETPRAALDLGALAPASEFLAWGTNDLTQLTLGLARGAGAEVVAGWTELGLDGDPAVRLEAGVLALLAEGLRRARAVAPGIRAGVCGRHGADPASIRELHAASVDYVSVAAAEVPRARVAAAQAALAG
jgi:phosphoenolpyruvate-protein kinase (PTS system EI component)